MYFGVPVQVAGRWDQFGEGHRAPDTAAARDHREATHTCTWRRRVSIPSEIVDITILDRAVTCPGSWARCLGRSAWSARPDVSGKPRCTATAPISDLILCSRGRASHNTIPRLGRVPVYRPALFVGSSSEGQRIAAEVQVLLDPVCEVELWTQGMFGLTQGGLSETLQLKLSRISI